MEAVSDPIASAQDTPPATKGPDPDPVVVHIPAPGVQSMQVQSMQVQSMQVQSRVEPRPAPVLPQWTDITVEADDRLVPSRPDFPRTGWGHRGYDPEQVDSFIAGLLAQVEDSHGEIEDLRRELDRLHRYIRREWSSAGRSPGAATVANLGAAAVAQADEIAQERLAEADRRLVEARALGVRRVEEAGSKAATLLAEAREHASALLGDAESQAAQRLAAAEEMAEQTMARAWKETSQSRERAERTARTALATVQTRYQEIVVRAHQRAEQAASNALHDLEQHATGSDDPAEARAELQLRAAYLHTSAEVSRAAMRAALSFAGREFDRLMGSDDQTPTGGVALVELPE